MKTVLPAIIALLLASYSSLSQYYLRGEVRDEQGNPLPNVKFNIYSKGHYPYYTGSNGGFGIPSILKIDTIMVVADGYEPFKAPVRSGQYEIYSLKMTASRANSSKLKLSSVTLNLLTNSPYTPSSHGESYSSTVENAFVTAKLFPQTGFALSVDRASYSNIRRFLNTDSEVPSDAVRIEEMLNYFNFNLGNKGTQNETFTLNTAVTSCPWNEKNRLLFINLKAKKISLENSPPSNLVFLVDVSGSMDRPNRLPLLKTGFKLLIENLRSIDTVSLVSYANGVSVMLAPTAGNEKQKILEAVEGLTPAGSTNGEAAIRIAYRFAERSFIKGGTNRVILATDGDFNVGMTSEKELEELITSQRQSGIYLTCLGVGMGNYKDSKLEALAKRGNGNFAYLDNEQEAEKMLVEEFAQTMFTIANDVFLNVHFNPAIIREYRLIGFDNKRNAVADSVSELEGGEVGSGQNVLSVFEVVPADNSNSALTHNAQLATLKLSYKLPGSSNTVQYAVNVPFEEVVLEKADPCLRFAASVIMFGSILKQSAFLNNISFDYIQNIASAAIEPNNRLQMEFIELVQKAKKIYSRKRKKG